MGQVNNGAQKKQAETDQDELYPMISPDFLRCTCAQDVHETTKVSDQPDLNRRNQASRERAGDKDLTKRLHIGPQKRGERLGRRVTFRIGDVGVDQVLEIPEHRICLWNISARYASQR